jgi:AcrR family transcriptional regulator
MPKIAGRDRKQELLETARDLIFTEGATRFTIRRLAERVDISEAAVYRHFESKEALLLHLVETLFQGWEENIGGILRGSGTAARRLRELARFHLEYLLHKQFNPVLFLSDATDPTQKTLQTKLQSIAQALRESISQLLREGKKSGEFAADLLIATGTAVFLGGIQSVVLQWTLTQRSQNLHRELQSIVEYLLRGYHPATESRVCSRVCSRGASHASRETAPAGGPHPKSRRTASKTSTPRPSSASRKARSDESGRKNS